MPDWNSFRHHYTRMNQDMPPPKSQHVRSCPRPPNVLAEPGGWPLTVSFAMFALAIPPAFGFGNWTHLAIFGLGSVLYLGVALLREIRLIRIAMKPAETPEAGDGHALTTPPE